MLFYLYHSVIHIEGNTNIQLQISRLCWHVASTKIFPLFRLYYAVSAGNPVGSRKNHVVQVYITARARHTQTPRFLCVPTISVAGRLLAAGLSRATHRLHLQFSHSHLLPRCSDDKISWLGGWASQWSPPQTQAHAATVRQQWTSGTLSFAAACRLA